MKIYLFPILILLPILHFGYSPEKMHSANNPGPTPTPYKKPVDVERVDLDKTEIRLRCQPGASSFSRSCSDDDMLVDVRTTTSNNTLTNLKYKYTVTKGNIRGTGAKVKWDLWEVPAGRYELTVAVDGGCGFCGESKTVSVNIIDCPDCFDQCECPSISVSGPANEVEAGNSVTFTATVSGGSQQTVKYHWTISAGKITSGQGTPSIEVSTTQDMAGAKITATVDIGGLDSRCNCMQTASETVSVRSNQQNHN
jgi:hypothetical protein